MFIHRQENERSVLIDFLKGIKWENPFAITTNMTPKVWRDVSQNFRHFMNRLNQRLLGNSFRRFGVRLRVLPIIEGCETSNPHYHCIIDNPFPDRDTEFTNAIKEAWWKTELGRTGRTNILVKRMEDDGWLRYMTKRRSKKSLLDSVDWQNTNI
jgi:hypothetical protein